MTPLELTREELTRSRDMIAEFARTYGTSDPEMAARASVQMFRINTALLVAGQCYHPPMRIDGLYDPRLMDEPAGCLTCGDCGTSVTADVRADFAEKVHGGALAVERNETSLQVVGL